MFIKLVIEVVLSAILNNLKLFVKFVTKKTITSLKMEFVFKIMINFALNILQMDFVCNVKTKDHLILIIHLNAKNLKNFNK